MAKAGRGQTRRDSKRRVLRPGESVRADGKYQYKYHIDGKPHFVYSWKLELTDKLPKGKKPCFVTQEIGEAGQYGFEFAGKYRGRADDSVRIGRPISENQNRSKAEHQAGICYSAEITCKGIFLEKDNPKCENIGCQVISHQAATGRWKKLQFHSYHPGSAATSFSDGCG